MRVFNKSRSISTSVNQTQMHVKKKELGKKATYLEVYVKLHPAVYVLVETLFIIVGQLERHLCAPDQQHVEHQTAEPKGMHGLNSN